MILDLTQAKILVVGIGANALITLFLLLILNQAGVQASFGVAESVPLVIFMVALAALLTLNCKPDLFTCGEVRIDVEEDEEASCESMEMQASESTDDRL